MSIEQLNGLQLPSSLIQALRDGTWTEEGKHWHDVFPGDDIGWPTLYSVDLMRQVNETWRGERDEIFIGVADGKASPGALDPARSVLIGELQTDTMIALDYRDEDRGGPSVAFLNGHGRWVAVAPSFDDFWRRLTGGRR